MVKSYIGVALALTAEWKVAHEPCPIFCRAGLCQYPCVQISAIAEQLQRVHFAGEVEQLVAILHHHSKNRAGDMAADVEGAQANTLGLTDLLL
ncbi:hypothetical protein D3C77_298530 [compost metagenome]